MAVANILFMRKSEKYERDSKIYQAMVEKQKQIYSQLLEHDKEIRRFRHDVNHHMNLFHNLLESGNIDKAKEYLEDMYGVIRSTSNISTGNVCLDIVLNDLWKDRQDIELKWSGMFPPEAKLSVTDIDICILFSNLFRNALEATETVEIDKCIYAKTRILGNNIVFTLTNPYREVEHKNNRFVSTKDPKNRGFGLRNIEEIVKKYDGNVDYSAKEMFVTEIILVNVIIEDPQ